MEKNGSPIELKLFPEQQEVDEAVNQLNQLAQQKDVAEDLLVGKKAGRFDFNGRRESGC